MQAHTAKQSRTHTSCTVTDTSRKWIAAGAETHKEADTHPTCLSGDQMEAGFDCAVDL